MTLQAMWGGKLFNQLPPNEVFADSSEQGVFVIAQKHPDEPDDNPRRFIPLAVGHTDSFKKTLNDFIRMCSSQSSAIHVHYCKIPHGPLVWQDLVSAIQQNHSGLVLFDYQNVGSDRQARLCLLHHEITKGLKDHIEPDDGLV